MPEITFMVRISSWNFVRVPRFRLEILIRGTVSAIQNKFRENILKSPRNVSETPPWVLRDQTAIDHGSGDAHILASPESASHMVDSSLRPGNERRRYFVTPSLIGWAQT